MRLTATLLGMVGALVAAGTAGAQPANPEPDHPSCDPAVDPNCARPVPAPPGPLQNPSDVSVPPAPPPEPTYGGALEPAPAPYSDVGYAGGTVGVGLLIGGGVDGFTNSALRDTTNAGGAWDVRAIFGTRSPLALEAAYIGSAQSISALGLDKDAVLVGNGVQGDVRLNVLGGRSIEPFVYGGVAWRRYNITNTRINTSDLVDNDDVLELPAGIGVAFRRSGFMAEARGEVRAAMGEDLLPTRTGGTETMHRWGVNANLGYEF